MNSNFNHDVSDMNKKLLEILCNERNNVITIWKN